VVRLSDPSALAEVRLVAFVASGATVRSARVSALVVRLSDPSALAEVRLVLGRLALVVLEAHRVSLLRAGPARIVRRSPARRTGLVSCWPPDWM
jgi:hypothetical protein